VAININPASPGQIAPQDQPGQQVATNVPSQPGAGAPTATGNLPSEADQIAAHAGLVAQASQALQDVTSGATQPDLNGEGARLLALHLRQQLAGQSLSIANQAPQSLLALLR